jgi:uncharacterized Rmd1/YagE family protein
MAKEIQLDKQEADEVVEITKKLDGFDKHLHRFALQHQKVIEFQLKTTESDIHRIANNEINLNNYEDVIYHREMVWAIARRTYKVTLDETMNKEKGAK